MTTKELTGQLTSITHAAEVVILSFHESGQIGTVAFSIPNQRYHQLFPAGEPVLGEDIVVVIDQEQLDSGQTTVKIQTIYDPEGDFIPVDEVSGDNLITNAEKDVYAELRALRDQQVAQITLSIDELDDLEQEHEQEAAKAGQVPEFDYGDIVIDQLREEDSDGQ